MLYPAAALSFQIIASNSLARYSLDLPVYLVDVVVDQEVEDLAIRESSKIFSVLVASLRSDNLVFIRVFARTGIYLQS